jgi:hypothetical protein
MARWVTNSQDTIPSTCICTLTGSRSTLTVEQTKGSH